MDFTEFMSKAMRDTPLQNPKDFCFECPNYLQYKKDDNIANLRYQCQACRCFTNKGIYKADIIAHYLNTFNNKGRKSVALKRYGVVVSNLLSDGKSLRYIAKKVGISVNTVIKIRDELRKEK